MNKLKSSLTCSYCSKIYKNPIELPCKDYICKEHLTEKTIIKENKIKCAKCNEDFEVRDNVFETNKIIQQQLDDGVYLSEEEFNLRQNVNESIRVFYQIYEEFTLSKNKLDLECHNHFQEIRFQLDLHREKLKDKIDHIYMEMIDKTKEFETSYLKELGEKLEDFSTTTYEVKSADEDLKEMEKKFREPNILIESIKKIQINQQHSIALIQLKLKEMTEIKENLEASNQFKPNLSFDQDSFGQLNLKMFLNEIDTNCKSNSTSSNDDHDFTLYLDGHGYEHDDRDHEPNNLDDNQDEDSDQDHEQNEVEDQNQNQHIVSDDDEDDNDDEIQGEDQDSNGDYNQDEHDQDQDSVNENEYNENQDEENIEDQASISDNQNQVEDQYQDFSNEDDNNNGQDDDRLEGRDSIDGNLYQELANDDHDQDHVNDGDDDNNDDNVNNDDYDDYNDNNDDYDDYEDNDDYEDD